MSKTKQTLGVTSVQSNAIFISERKWFTFVYTQIKFHMKPGEFSRRKTGHTKCPGCPQVYNNRAIPERCSACNTYIGGKYVAPVKKLGAILITACIVSVRQSETGHNVRTFVDMSKEKKV